MPLDPIIFICSTDMAGMPVTGQPWARRVGRAWQAADVALGGSPSLPGALDSLDNAFQKTPKQTGAAVRTHHPAILEN